MVIELVYLSIPDWSWMVSCRLSAGAEGVGLYRTELTFMMRDRFPSEERTA